MAQRPAELCQIRTAVSPVNDRGMRPARDDPVLSVDEHVLPEYPYCKYHRRKTAIVFTLGFPLISSK
jgi:hypothetical protein